MDIWQAAAQALGWKWVDAFAAYTREGCGERPEAAEDACFLDEIETLEQAEALITEDQPCPPLDWVESAHDPR